MDSELLGIDGVKRAIKAQRDSYVVPESSVLGGYIQRSRECVLQYNGRQIFEMLQNVDDQLDGDTVAESDRICKITLDKDRDRLVFRNKGNPFSVKGVKSIMYPDSSPKRIDKLATIGNKGLGFRSLLNWNPSAIFIRSNGVELQFSQSVLDEDYLRQDKDLSAAMAYAREGQLPMLTFPRPAEWNGDNGEWVTEVELLGIHASVSEIESELRNFRSELMLFLPHLRTVVIEIFEEGQSETVRYSASKRTPILDEKLQLQERVISKITGADGSAVTETTKWLICWWRNPLSENGKPVECNVEVAIPQGEGSGGVVDGVLYNYLPTKVRVKLPCLVHATVKLEDHRNTLVTRNALNKKVFSEILPEVIVNFALAIRDHKLVEDKWLPFTLLAAPTECDDKEYVGVLYARLRSALNKLEVCPCVDGKWRSLCDSRYCAPRLEDKCDITKFFNTYPLLMPNYVYCGAPDLLAGIDAVLIKDVASLRTQLNVALTDKEHIEDYTVQARADLVCVLWQFAQRGLKHAGPCWVFVSDEKNVFDAKQEIVYTPVSVDKIILPEYMKADYVSDDLWSEITARFSREINQVAQSADSDDDVKKNKERTFCKYVLRDLLGLRIDYYDRSTVAKQMVSTVRQKLKDEQLDIESKRNLVGQLFKALLDNYRVDAEPGAREDCVPLFVNDDGQVVCANEVLFESAKPIYEGALPDSVFLDKDRIADLFKDLDVNVDQGKFLRYLGVRGDVRVDHREIRTNAGRSDGFLLFLQQKGRDNGGLPEASHSYDALKAPLRVVGIMECDLPALKRLPVSRFFELYGLEQEDGLFSLIAAEPGNISWNAVSGRETSYSSYSVRWSYVAYQLKERLAGVIFGENDKVLADLGWRFEQNKKGVSSSVLVKLGAKSKLADLSPEELYGLVNKIAESGHHPTKDFYKKINAALSVLEEHGVTISPPKGLKVFASDGNFRVSDTVYYHDNPAHAKLLAKDKPMMYLSSRVGVDKVCRHFGVKKLDESDIALGESVLVEKLLQERFDHYYLAKAPLLSLLLCQHRSGSLEESKREVTGTHIVLVRSKKYAYGRKNVPDCQLADFAYLRDPNEGSRVFYLCIGDRSGLDDLARDDGRRYFSALAGILCDMVKLSDELLERQLYECFADEEKTRMDLEDAGYLDNIDLSVAAEKNYYAMHISAMRNFAETVYVEKIKPAVWKFLNQHRDLQEYYVQYEPRYRDSIERALADGGDLESICLEKQNDEWPNDDLRSTVWNYITQATWWRDLPRPLPEDVDRAVKEAAGTVEPIPGTLYQRMWDSEIEDSRVNSLFYFENNEERIALLLPKQVDVVPATNPVASLDHGFPLLNVSQAAAVFSRPHVSVHGDGIKRGGGQAMTTRRLRNQKVKGDLAEALVEYWLKNAAGNKQTITSVERVSGTSHNSSRNDALHYDIRYVQDGIMHQVEVKACDSGEFHISAGELNFAKDHPGTYHLALVYTDTHEVQFVDDVYRRLSNVRVADGWKVAVSRQK